LSRFITAQRYETMQTILGSSIAAMGVAVFFRWPEVVKEGRAVTVWLSMVGLLLFALFQVDGLCLAVGGPSRWPAYLFLVLAVYFLSISFTGKSPDAPSCGRRGSRGFFLGRSPGHKPGFFTPEQPRWMASCLAAVLVALVSLAAFSQELPLVGLSYGYAVVTLSVAPIRCCIRALREEGTRLPPHVRLRTALILPTLGVIVLSCTLELLVRAPSALFPMSSTLLALYVVSKALQAIAICLWSLCFLADRVYDDLLIRPARFVRKLATLRRLSRLKARLDVSLRLVSSATAASTTGKTTWRERLRDPDYHIYQTVIGILDDEKVLARYLEDGGALWPGDARSLREAQRLGRALRERIREDTSFERLVEALRAL
jgi:hypothetical protein